MRELLRPLLGQNVLSCRRKDAILHHALVPSCDGVVQTNDYTIHFKTNSWGLRGEEFQKQKSKDVYRVLVLGDSYVEGWGVNEKEHFITIAEQLLEKKGKKVEIINAGVASYSPVLELEFLRTKGVQLNPDLVIMMIDPNDMHDEYFYGGWDRHMQLRESLFPKTAHTIKRWPEENRSFLKRATNHSALLSMVYERVKSSRDIRNQTISLENLTIHSAIYSQAQDWENFEKAFALLNDTVLLTDGYLKQKDIAFAITTSSRGAYHSTKEWNPGRKVWGYDEGKVYAPKPVMQIEKLAKEREISYINVFGALKDTKQFPLYYPRDGHWTAKANTIVGEVIAAYIEKQLSPAK